MWYMPYAFAAADILHILDFGQRLAAQGAAKFSHYLNQNQGHAINCDDKEERKVLTAIDANLRHHSRRSHILDILSSVLRIATRRGAVRTFGEVSAEGAKAVKVFTTTVCHLIDVSDDPLITPIPLYTHIDLRSILRSTTASHSTNQCGLPPALPPLSHRCNFIHRTNR